MPDSFATPWIVLRHSPLSVGFSRHKFWRGLRFCVPWHFWVPGFSSNRSGRCEGKGTQGTQLSCGSWVLRSLGSSRPRDQTHISCPAGGFFLYHWAAWEAQFLEWWLSCRSSLCALFAGSMVGKAWVGKPEENSRCGNCRWVYSLWAGSAAVAAADTLFSCGWPSGHSHNAAIK